MRVTPGDFEARTPATFDLPRERAPYRVAVGLVGHHAAERRLERATNPWVWGNLPLPLTAAFVLVDWATGALNAVVPEQLDVELEPVDPDR